MRTSIIRIGNSEGVRIPKTILKECHLEGEVEMERRGDELVIRSLSKRRQKWEEAFQKMTEEGDDSLLDSSLRSPWDESEWKW